MSLIIPTDSSHYKQISKCGQKILNSWYKLNHQLNNIIQLHRIHDYQIKAEIEDISSQLQ
jgi:biotin-(acetyl-CoA carboxylase) ligase